MKKLPIGIHTFSEIIKNDYLYIDKTKEAYEILNTYKYVFLSRPRRFGKSLFLTTLQAIFEGKKEFFKGLYIYDKYDFEPYPVIRIHWGGNFTSEFNFQSEVQSALNWNAEYLGITLDRTLSLSAQFDSLIKETYKTYNKRVVILIDEYDKPILDNITNPEMRNYARDTLKGLYAHINYNKDALYTLFALLPYQNYTNNDISIYEGFYASVTYAFLASLAVPLIGEDVTNRRRIDLTLNMEHKIYIIEFKVGSGNALQQIKEKKYYEKYRNLNKDIYLVGINFDEQARNISGFVCEGLF